MNEECGEAFVECTNYNHDLIDFEFGFNNFKLDQVHFTSFIFEQTIKIQDNLMRNKAEYDAERLKEWRERKLMNDEDIRLKNLYLEE